MINLLVRNRNLNACFNISTFSLFFFSCLGHKDFHLPVIYLFHQIVNCSLPYCSFDCSKESPSLDHRGVQDFIRKSPPIILMLKHWQFLSMIQQDVCDNLMATRFHPIQLNHQGSSSLICHEGRKFCVQHCLFFVLHRML